MKKVEQRLLIKCPSENVISAFTEQTHLAGWWGVERSLVEKKIGGIYTLTWQISDHGFGFISSGIIKQYISNQLLNIGNMVYLNPDREILGPMQLTISAHEVDDSSNVLICQEGYQEGSDWQWYYEAVKNAWPIAGLQLKNYLEK